MSILIKGMAMPKNCEECAFNYDMYRCMITLKSTMLADTERLSDCPLIELPPHGRLIDADALNALIDSGDDIDFSEVPETKYAIMQMVNEQDTILEASPYRYKMIGKTDKPHGIYFIESEEEDG